MTEPQPANEPAPWTGREILVALFLLYGFWPALSLQLFIVSGLAEWLYGPAVTTLYNPPAGAIRSDPEEREAQAPSENEDAAARRTLRIRLNMWAAFMAFPFQAVTVPAVFYMLRGVPASRIGLTWHRFRRNVLSGLGAWLLITPLVFCVNIVVIHFCSQMDPDTVQEHALTRLARSGPSGAEWMLIVFTAIVVAPVLEETVFRGVLQPWFAGLRKGGNAAMIAAFTVALVFRQNEIVEAFRHDRAKLLTAVMPALFVLVLVPSYLVIARWPPRPDSPTVFATALLFASFHASVWPTPVPLFVLGLALGMLAARTGSLVGPMVLHGLFNAVTCVMLALGLAGA